MAQPILRLTSGGPDPIQRAADQTLRIDVYDRDSGAASNVTAATLALYNQGGNVLLAPSAGTAANGYALYSLLAATVPDTLAIGEGYREEWALTVGGVVYTIARDAVLCRRVPVMALTLEDLYTRHPEIDGIAPSRQGATAWIPQINEAWVEIQQRLYDRGQRPWLVWSVGSIRQAHLELTLSLIFRTLSTGPLGDSRWMSEAERHEARYAAEWDRLRFDVDLDSSGTMDEQQGAPILMFGAGPTRRMWGTR